MDDLNAFKADLARLREGDDSLQRDPSDQSLKETTRGDQDEGDDRLSLGRALVVLFQTRPSALKRAIKDETADDRHVQMSARIDKPDDEAAPFERMREVYRPMLDKLIKKGNDNEKAVAYILLDWLFKEFEHRNIMLKAIAMDLECLTDKKQKLAVLMALNYTIVEQGMSLLKAGEGRDAHVLPLDGNYLVEYTGQLATIVQRDSIVQPDGTKAMTRLTAMALDLVLMITRFLAENVKRAMQEKRPTEESSADAGHPLIILQQEVDPEPFKCLKHAALKDLTELATKFIHSNVNFRCTTTERGDVDRLARLWTIVMPCVSTSTASLSLQHTVKSIQSHIASHDQDTGARVICCSMMLGYVDPSISVKELLTGKLFVVSDVELLGKVLDLTNSVIAGYQSVGRHSAYAIQRQLSLSMDEEQVRAHLPKMLSFLDHDDEVSKAIAEMVANYAIAFPSIVVPEFVGRLKADHKEIVRIRSILAIVEEMAEQGFLTAPLDAETDRIRDSLIDVLLSKLSDNDLKIRMTSGHIASAIDPSKLVHTLVPSLQSKDEKIRSSAELALVECLLAQRKDRPASEGLTTLVDAIRKASPESTIRPASAGKSKPAKSPGELLAQQKRSPPPPTTTTTAQAPSMKMGPDEDTLRLERVARVIHKWAEAVPPSTWPLYVERLVKKTYGSPSDQNLIRVWKEIGVSIASSTEGMTSVLLAVLSILEQQGTVTVDELEQAVEASDEAIDDLRYARLSPLLILKTIPPEGYIKLFQGTSEDIKVLSQRALAALKSRTENPVEFNHVKQMAFALMPSMFPNSSLEQIHSRITGLLRSSEVAFDDIKSWVISLYNWITTWSISTCSPEQLGKDIAWLCKILRDALLPILAIPMPTDDSSQALYKLQLGVMDALSQLILATVPYHKVGTRIGPHLQQGVQESALTPKIQEITEDDDMKDADLLSLDHPDGVKKPSELFAVLLTAMLERIARPAETRDFDQIGTAVCLANSLILTMQRLFQGSPSPSTPLSASASSTSVVNNTTPPTIPRSWIPSILLDLVTPTLVTVVHETLQAGENDTSLLQSSIEGVPGFDMLLTGCFQVMYTGVNAVALVAAQPSSHRPNQVASDDSSPAGTRTTGRATDQGMMGAVVAGLESEQLRVAVAALKLLGTLAATGTVQEAGLLTPLNLAKIRRGLGWLGSAEIKAQEKVPEIAPLLDKMWEMVA
ncbi:hypothetical protein DFQ27_000233 [Actinomortierella ambigua]|uniref:Uncharacterized protein n=1 Tax=Actinomortierella ambigua TaxID=1343610 RepID=A0A9P6U951_9FUNG|nr:hypothetical protein DFQ27_000233 [Actinomortierella ambigua]